MNKQNNKSIDDSFSFENYTSPTKFQGVSPIKTILVQSKYKLNAFLSNLDRLKNRKLLAKKDKNTIHKDSTKSNINILSQINNTDENSFKENSK